MSKVPRHILYAINREKKYLKEEIMTTPEQLGLSNGSCPLFRNIQLKGQNIKRNSNLSIWLHKNCFSDLKFA